MTKPTHPQNSRKMSFSGKKFKRTRCERIHELLKATNASDNIKRLLTCCNPVFSFTKVDDSTIAFRLEINGTVKGFQFSLDKEVVMERVNGSKVKLYFTMEGEHILHQTIKLAEGKFVFFTREFNENDAKMTVSMTGSDIEAVIYYELVE